MEQIQGRACGGPLISGSTVALFPKQDVLCWGGGGGGGGGGGFQ